MLDWNDFKLVLAISRRGSFLQAGAMLGLAASTVSRRISRLEHVLGEPVVERSVEGVRLTARGRSLVELAERVEREVSHASAPAGDDLCGTVTVSTGDGFVPVALQTVEKFTRSHPGCSVDLLIDSKPVRLSRSGVDIALRTVHLGEPSLIYQRVASLTYDLYCTKAFAMMLGSEPEAGQAPMIDLTPPLDQAAHLRAARRQGFVSARLRVSTFTAQLMAVRDGLGVGVLPDILANGLEKPFGYVSLPAMDVFMASRVQALHQPHVRAFYDLLKAAIRDALRSGSPPMPNLG